MRPELEKLNEYEIQDALLWSIEELRDRALEFLQSCGAARDEWLDYVRRLADEQLTPPRCPTCHRPVDIEEEA